MDKIRFEEIASWQKKTFGAATAMSKLAHLADELVELSDDLISNNPGKRLEFADCFILLFGAASADGMSYDDIIKAIDDKMAINYNRKWGQPNKLGVVNHIREDGLEQKEIGEDRRTDDGTASL